MKKHLILIALILILIPTGIYAGDYAKLNFIGISKDGKYLAFEQYGVQDGSGFAYSNTYFIDVEKNEYAGKPVPMMIENESITLDSIRNKAGNFVVTKLKKLGIVRGNTGTMVVARLLTDSDVARTPYKI
jgi:predicted secreted protein